MAAGAPPGPGDVQDLVEGEVGRGQAGRGLGEGAVAAAVPAEHGEGDEDLGRVGDPVAHGPVPHLAGGRRQLGRCGQRRAGRRRRRVTTASPSGLGVDEPADLGGPHPGGGDVVAGHQAGHRLRAWRRPSTVKTTRRARAMAGSVRVSRGWGLAPSGSSVATTSRSGPASSEGAPGNSEAVWPSGPIPRWTRSSPASGQDRGQDRCRRRRRRPRGRRRWAWGVNDPTAAHRLDQGLAHQPLVGVGVVGRDQPLVAHVDVDRRPVDGPRRQGGQPLVAAPGRAGRPRAPG